MNDRSYYHNALESALLDGANLKERINARILNLPKRRDAHVRLPKRLIIALVAAAILMISSVAVAVAVTRNQAFKEQTNAELEQTIQTVTQPLDSKKKEGWQPLQLILFDNVWGIRQDVTDTYSNGRIQLAEFYFSEAQWLTVEFWVFAEKDEPHSLSELTITIDDDKPRNYTHIDAVDQYYDGHFLVNANFAVVSNPFWPGTKFKINGKIDGEAFELNYTFSEEIYQKLQQSIVDAANEHKEVVEQIPDQGTPVGYRVRNTILCEVAVKDRCMYFTTLCAPDGQRYYPDDKLPYSRFDRGLWPVIDGRTGDFYYLGNIDAENPEGAVYCTYLPYSETTFPDVSLIAFEGIMFRYEWATGNVTLPKDEEEYEAWRKESMELSAQLCEADWIWQFDEELGDVQVTDLVFHTLSMWSDIGIVFESEQGFSDPSELPRVWLNGVALAHVGEIDPLTSTEPYIRSDGKKLAYCMVGFSPAELGDTFILTVEWRGSKKDITLHMSDVLREDAQEIKEYKSLFHY